MKNVFSLICGELGQILDEATSALDNKSEAIVQKAMDNLMRTKLFL